MKIKLNYLASAFYFIFGPIALLGVVVSGMGSDSSPLWIQITGTIVATLSSLFYLRYLLFGFAKKTDKDIVIQMYVNTIRCPKDDLTAVYIEDRINIAKGPIPTTVIHITDPSTASSKLFGLFPITPKASYSLMMTNKKVADRVNNLVQHP